LQDRKEKREVEAGQPFVLQPGEKVVGSKTVFQRSALDTQIDEYAASQGIQYGDAIARITTALGVPPCSKCKKRISALNEVAKVGWLNTLKKLKEIGV